MSGNNDNASAHSSGEYDEKITQTIPFYPCFHAAALDLVRARGIINPKWLDTGCGTGTLCEKARADFPGAAFALADPSEKMLEAARRKLARFGNVSFTLADTQSLAFPDESFGVITAIQCHHYIHEAERKKATENVYRMLKPGGVYITFENIHPETAEGEKTGLAVWRNYQIQQGKTEAEADAHIGRYGKEYFPITVPEHLRLLRRTGFRTAEILWFTVMQAGFYAMK